MIKTIINVNILTMVVFILFWSGVSKAMQSDTQINEFMMLQVSEIPVPDLLPDTYLNGSREEKSRQCRDEVASPLEEECSYCHNDEVTTFTKKGEKAVKMMKAAVAIGVKCDFCHVGKDQFTGMKEIAESMFELSEITATECNYCHAGRNILTTEGKTAKTAMILQEWAKTGSKKCLDCHVEKKQFELNFRGWEVLNTQKGLLGL